MSYTEAPIKAEVKTPKKAIATSIVSAAPKPKKSSFKSIKKIQKIQILMKNLANTFSNIGFILNSTYAKRNNIDPAIVAHKRKKM